MLPLLVTLFLLPTLTGSFIIPTFRRFHHTNTPQHPFCAQICSIVLHPLPASPDDNLLSHLCPVNREWKDCIVSATIGEKEVVECTCWEVKEQWTKMPSPTLTMTIIVTSTVTLTRTRTWKQTKTGARARTRDTSHSTSSTQTTIATTSSTPSFSYIPPTYATTTSFHIHNRTHTPTPTLPISSLNFSPSSRLQPGLVAGLVITAIVLLLGLGIISFALSKVHSEQKDGIKEVIDSRSRTHGQHGSLAKWENMDEDVSRESGLRNWVSWMRRGSEVSSDEERFSGASSVREAGNASAIGIARGDSMLGLG